jgi:hypothetical protein
MRRSIGSLALASSGPRRPGTMTRQRVISLIDTPGPGWNWIRIGFEAGDGGKEAIQYLKLDLKQVSKQKENCNNKGESPYWVPVDSNIVRAHLLGWWLATDVLDISCRSSCILLGLGVTNVSRFGSWTPLYSHLGCTCFFRGTTRRTSQWAATQTPVKPWFLRSLTRLPKAAMIGSSTVVGSLN